MRITSASDMNGNAIGIKARIKYYDKRTEYTAVITGFEHYEGNVVRVTAIRDIDGTEVKLFSDSVARFRS
jgi:hypothetical protein